ncbi:unnamed protein product, partial [Mesorhabditis belari]|uniref:Aquaporin n=1 Tax=Mesorhabditis belari TaxID=2138241 RepID=A0AAF3F0Y6_9BILA
MIRLTNLWKCVIAEFIATTTLLLFGTTTNAQFTLGKGKSGDWLALCFGWAIGLTLSVQLAWRISGSHLNPAVSLFAWSTKQISFKRFLLYSLAQIAGAYCGAGLTFLEYREGIQSVDGGRRMVFGENGTAGIFTTFPQNYVSITGGYIDQILGTTILVFFIGSICDKRNAIPEFLKPVFIGGLLTLIGICLGN